MNVNRIFLVVWVVLAFLTLAAFAGEASGALRPGPAVLLGITFAKVLVVSGWYMELRHAHAAWRLGFGAVAGLILGGLWVLQGTTH